MNDLEKRKMDDDTLRGLKRTIDGFNEVCFKKVSPTLAESFANVFPIPKPRRGEESNDGKKLYGRKALDVE